VVHAPELDPLVVADDRDPHAASLRARLGGGVARAYRTLVRRKKKGIGRSRMKPIWMIRGQAAQRSEENMKTACPTFTARSTPQIASLVGRLKDRAPPRQREYSRTAGAKQFGQAGSSDG
jgi:hypothetical protein